MLQINCTTLKIQTPALPCVCPVLYCALYITLDGGGNSEVQYM